MFVAVWPYFWKGSLVSLVAYAAAVGMGLWMGFWFTLWVVPVFQTVWTAFCIIRIIQLRHGGGHRADASQWDRESYGFSLGGLTSSCAFLLLLVVATQVV